MNIFRFIFLYNIIEILRYIGFRRRLLIYRQNEKCKNIMSNNHNKLADDILRTFEKQKDFVGLIGHIFNTTPDKISRKNIYDFFKSNLHIQSDDNMTDMLIERIISVIEIGTTAQTGTLFRFKTEHTDDFDYFKSGREEINAYFKPLPILLLFKSFRFIVESILQFRGFQKKYGECGINFITKNTNVQCNSNKVLIFFHGIGVGFAPYYNFINIFEGYHKIIMVDMPNIGYGRYIDRYPTMTEIVGSITTYLRHYIPEIFLTHTDLPLKTLDIAGHSYGTTIISYLLRCTKFTSEINIGNIYLLDPICFIETSYKVSRASNVGIENFIAFERKSIFGNWKEITITFERIVQYFLVFCDLETQIVMKRHLFLHEITFPLEMLKDNIMVVLSEHDMFVHVNEVISCLKHHNIRVQLLKNCGHADMLTHRDARDMVRRFINM
jgi:hypothetical protein